MNLFWPGPTSFGMFKTNECPDWGPEYHDTLGESKWHWTVQTELLALLQERQPPEEIFSFFVPQAVGAAGVWRLEPALHGLTTRSRCSC